MNYHTIIIDQHHLSPTPTRRITQPDFMYKVCFEDEINSKFGYAGAVEIKAHHVIALNGRRSARPTATGTNTVTANNRLPVAGDSNAKNTKSKGKSKAKSSAAFIPVQEPYPRWIRELAGRLSPAEVAERPDNLKQSEMCDEYMVQELHEAFDMLLELGDSSDDACKLRLARGQDGVNREQKNGITEQSEPESPPDSPSTASSPSPPPARRRTKSKGGSRSKNKDKTWRC